MEVASSEIAQGLLASYLLTFSLIPLRFDVSILTSVSHDRKLP